ncbi:MAG: MFS transporter [Methylophilaceae bacterium]
MRKIDFHWRGIVVLNLVSTFSQLGQFGVGFLVMPIWLAARGMGAVELGYFGAAGWAGMLSGLLLTPKLLTKYSTKQAVLAGMLATVVGFLLIPQVGWPFWLISAFLNGFGLGLRWIANETWLYRIAPQHVVGKIAGFHEALISLAVVIGPLLVVWFSTAGDALVMIGALFSGIAALPLLFIASEKIQYEPPVIEKVGFFKIDTINALGMAISAAGGLIDGAFTSLFPIFGLGRGFAEAQIGSLLAVIGFGGLILQFPLGWFSDKFGFMKTSLLVAISTSIATFMMAFVAMSFAHLTMVSFIFGGVVASFLTLAIIAAASTNDQSLMARNMSKVAIVFTVCSIVGSLSAGFVAAFLGSDAFLWIVLIVSSLIVAIFYTKMLKNYQA